MTFPDRWLVIGAGGLLGRELTTALRQRGYHVLGPSRHELDITEPGAADRFLALHAPGIVVNCAAWTDVDGAEKHETQAHRLNGIAPRHLARACAASRIRLLHLSTDYVFSAVPHDADRPCTETTSPVALNAYGRSKLAGEHAVLDELPDLATVVRTSWLYGRHGANFVTTMLRHAAGTGRVRVVDDQHGQPTWTTDVVRALLLLATAPPTSTTGAFHATGCGSTTWYDLAREVFRLGGADPRRVVPVRTASLGRPAPRPVWSVLSHERWHELGTELPVRPWAEALSDLCRQELSTGLTD